MTYQYNLENFLSKPINGDQRLIINDKNNNYVDSIITDISHYFVKNNCLVIKITNKNDLILSFESRSVAQQALEKLDSYRKNLMMAKGDIVRPDRPTFNTLNHYMMADYVTGNTQHALQSPTTSGSILQQPKSSVKVIVNQGAFVYCGKPNVVLSGSTYMFYSPVGCYFTTPAAAGDPFQAKNNDGDVQLGDVLYWVVSWNGSGTLNYALDVTDSIDFEYLI